MPFNYKYITTCAIIFITAGAPLSGAGKHMMVEVFEIHYLDAHEIVGMVDTVLSRDGKVSATETSNSIIVRDLPKNISEVKKLLARIDIKPSTFLIKVKFVEEEKIKEIIAGLSFKASGPGWMIATDTGMKRDGVAVSLETSIKSIDSTRNQFIRVLENRTGTIFTGSEHPVTNVETHVYPGGQVTRSNTSYKKSGDSISVTARKEPKGKILVSLTPQTGSYNKQDGAYSVKSAATTVVVDDPGTIVIGGADGQVGSSTAGIPGGVRQRERFENNYMVLSVRSEK